jgi:hypothetical protein
VDAPLGINVKLLVLQIVPLFTVIKGSGKAVTVEIAGAAERQPRELVPVTEYVVVTVGLTKLDPPE